jgi:hypothetical protein
MVTFYRNCKFAHFGRILSFSLGTILLLSSCSGLSSTPVEQPGKPISVITGKPGGTKLSDFSKKDQSGNGLPVNALLWRAALDIASFVPLDDVDTFGGSIITEWHQSADNSNQRLKLTIFISGLELRSDAVKVQTYTQKKSGNDWVDNGRDEALARKLEDLILTRARELRAASVSETTQ